jgi:hypothetical protein
LWRDRLLSGISVVVFCVRIAQALRTVRIDPQGLRQRRCKDLVVKGRDGEFEAYFGH